MSARDLRDELRREIRRHPRVALQDLLGSDADREKLATALPTFIPFRAPTYAAGIWVVDWDHRLPSRELVLRLYAFYSEESLKDGLASFDERKEQIKSEELFPEFDVPDFAGLVADEAYEAELPLNAPPKKFRLVSEWRREIEPRLARKSEDIVRASHAFQELAQQMRARAPGLGDLEAAEWAPPSETGHPRWGIDVWYLRSFNGMVGEGTAFLVDVESQSVISQRDFQFRSG